MATQVLSSVANVFGVGTTVGAYLPGTIPEGPKISGAAVTTAVVQSSGSLTFTGLTEGVSYVAYDPVSGKGMRFTATAPAKLAAAANPTATTAPTVSSDQAAGYQVGSLWIDQTLDRIYECVDATPGAAIWKLLTPVVDVFTASGTWTKPAWCTAVDVVLVGAGGGGGAGRRGAAASARVGGGGGAGGGVSRYKMAAAVLNATEPVVVSAGGAGGVAQTVDTTDGAAGGAGGSAQFGLYWRTGSTGAAGGGGSGAGGAGGGAGTGNTGGSTGGAAASSTGLLGAAGGAIGSGAGGGGAGGGLTTGDVASAGGNGSVQSGTLTGATGGVVGGASPTIPTDQPANSGFPGLGGGGGASAASGAAQAGSRGGLYGGGGGGGGASLNGNASGAGGAGAGGIVVVISQ